MSDVTTFAEIHHDCSGGAALHNGNLNRDWRCGPPRTGDLSGNEERRGWGSHGSSARSRTRGRTAPKSGRAPPAGVSGDLAYTVGFEHTSVSVDGVPVEPYTLRVTHIYRREDGEWKIVHRHGDAPPVDQSLPGEASPA